jgi:hypothetical protein
LIYFFKSIFGDFFQRKGICDQIIFLQNGENSSPKKYHRSLGVLASDLKPIQAAS